MDSSRSFTDYHFLNTAFADVIDMLPVHWIDSSAIRLFYRGTKDGGSMHSIMALQGLHAEYTVPFPLGYILSSRIMATYNDIFVFLLQIRRSRAVLEGITMREGLTRSNHAIHWPMKVVHLLRQKLSWFAK